MTPEDALLHRLTRASWLRAALARRLCLSALFIVCALLSVWPQRHVARVKLVPNESGASLGGALSQIGGLSSLASLLGGRASVEVYLNIGRGHDVQDEVIRRLRLAPAGDADKLGQAELRLAKKTDIHTTRGGIIEIEVRDTNAATARKIAATYAAAFQDRMTLLSREQAAQKRAILSSRFDEARGRLAQAQAQVDQFRTENRLAVPEAQLGLGISMLADLQARLQAKRVELQAAQEFATGENIQVKAVAAEIGSLEQQIAKAQAQSRDQGLPNLASMSSKQTQYLNLYRNLQYQTGIFDIYQRYMEGVSVEELAANINVQVIEQPYVDPKLQLNLLFLGLAASVLILWATLEYYLHFGTLGEAP